jgi:uncharacterized protein
MNKIILFILIIFVTSSCSAQSEKNKSIILNDLEVQRYPSPIGYVNDFASILDSSEILRLEDKLKKYNELTTNQIIIITINDKNLTEENFDKYSLDISNYWGIGTKEKNNGLTIVLSTDLRKIRINTGIGTEKILTDEICNDVLNSLIIPEFKNEKYFEGLNNAVDKFIELWK